MIKSCDDFSFCFCQRWRQKIVVNLCWGKRMRKCVNNTLRRTELSIHKWNRIGKKALMGGPNRLVFSQGTTDERVEEWEKVWSSQKQEEAWMSSFPPWEGPCSLQLWRLFNSLVPRDQAAPTNKQESVYGHRERSILRVSHLSRHTWEVKFCLCFSSAPFQPSGNNALVC